MKTAFRMIQVIPCNARLDKESRGLFGFHDSTTCNDCRKVDHGVNVHDGDSIFAPLIGCTNKLAECSAVRPVFFTR